MMTMSSATWSQNMHQTKGNAIIMNSMSSGCKSSVATQVASLPEAPV
jgi:hypothetical protein